MSHSDRYWGENKKIEEIDMKMYEFLEKSTISAMIYRKYKTWLHPGIKEWNP